MILFTKNLPRFLVSRSKTLLKRRKIAVKKRPISNKKLKQQAKQINYSKQYRAMQIQKQLDKRVYPNEHIDELMEQIFYPDISYANEEALNISLQINKSNTKVDTEQPLQVREHEGNKYNSQEENIASMINEKITELILPEDLLKLYEKCTKKDEQGEVLPFSLENYSKLFEQFSEYFTDRQYITKKLLRDYEYRMQKMKKKNRNFQIKPCPYIFFDRQDIYRYEPWWNLISEFTAKISEITQSSKRTNQNIVDQFIEEIKIGASIQRFLGTIPSPIYHQIIKKAVTIFQRVQLNKNHQIFLLYFINLHKKQKYPENSVFDGINQSTETNQKLWKFCQKACLQILQESRCSPSHLQIVMNYYREHIKQFDDKEEQFTKRVTIASLSQIKVQKVIDYLETYIKKSIFEDTQFIELLKYDIYRKLPTIQSKTHLLRCLALIKSGTFIRNSLAKNLQINHTPISATQLFHKIAQTLLGKYCGKSILTSENTRVIVWHFFINRMRDSNLLQLIANELVKNKDEIALEKFTQSVLQLNLLGYRSPLLSEVLFNEFLKRYSAAKNKCKDKTKYFLPSDKQIEIESGNRVINKQQLHLEESLIITIWLFVSTTRQSNLGSLGNTKNTFKIRSDSLLSLYPVKTTSKHPFIHQLCKNIYYLLSQNFNLNSLFFPIKYKTLKAQDAEQFTNSQIKDIYRKYYGKAECTDDVISLAMNAEARESGKFIYNYNYGTKKYLKDSWSECDIYDQNAYLKWVNQSRGNLEINNFNYFNPQIKITIQLSNLRKKVCLSADQKSAEQAEISESKQTLGNFQKQNLNYYKLD